MLFILIFFSKGGGSDSGKYLELKFIEKSNSDKLSLNDLKAHGLTSPLQGPCRVTAELRKYIDAVIK